MAGLACRDFLDDPPFDLVWLVDVPKLPNVFEKLGLVLIFFAVD